jgi:hypothetical protein
VMVREDDLIADANVTLCTKNWTICRLTQCRDPSLLQWHKCASSNTKYKATRRAFPAEWHITEAAQYEALLRLHNCERVTQSVADLVVICRREFVLARDED